MVLRLFTFIGLLLLLSCQNDTTALQTEISQLKSEIAHMAKDAMEDETEFIHTVYFYAKKDITEERKKEFLVGLEMLATVPSIYKVYYGPPANTDREIVDNSYLYAWVCHFRSAADQAAYQKDPIHLKFVAEYEDVWERVAIYDNLSPFGG